MDITPSPRILRMLGEIEFAEWQCIAELIDNAFDDFTEIIASGEPWPGGFKVSVSLPSPRGGLDDAEVVVQDTGRGMNRVSLENAVRAGWSSNDRFDKLGLFGMGFNVSTARLGDRTTVLTSRMGDASWTGVEIDLTNVREDFNALDIETQKEDPGEHGTRIAVGRLKPRHAQWMQRNATQLREVLGRTYSWLLANQPIELWVGGVQVKPRQHCVWSDERYVTFGSGIAARQIPAVMRFDQKLSNADACNNCGNWQEAGDTMCRACGASNLVARERKIHGWLGVQRHLDKRSFGVDFLRNGRKILQNDKRIFDWSDPNDPVGGTATEYPVEMVHLGGRIVGEIHLDHVPVTYSKDAFEYSDRGWRSAMEYLRGPGPILPKSAERLGYPINESPLALLVQGYRRVDAGRRCLIPGDGKGPIHETTREWAKKFWQGIPEYQQDDKWWEAVESHESRKSASRVENALVDTPDKADLTAVLEALGDANPEHKDSDTAAASEIEPHDSAEEQETLSQRVERLRSEGTKIPDLSKEFGLPDLGILDVGTYIVGSAPLHDESGHRSPVWLSLGAGRSASVFIDPTHEYFTRFGATYSDALLAELVPVMRVRASSRLSHTRLTASLRAACLPDTATDFQTIQSQAFDLVTEVRSRFIPRVRSDHQRAIDYLSPDEMTSIENGIIQDGGALGSQIWSEGTFLNYVPPLYLVTLLESWPEVFMDNHVFRGPYTSVSSPATRRLSLTRTAGYLGDLASILTAQAPPSPAQLQRVRWSCELLSDEMDIE